jgi:K(+)-stimulated pyrophosphate-energized sodium pump
MSGSSKAPEQSAAPAAPAVASAAASADGASFVVENGVVKFYFASGKAEVATGAGAALADVAKAVSEGKRAVLSGFTDASGDPAKNEELAKQRAFAVRDALKAAGVAEDKIELKKPEQLTGSGDAAQARRVEVALQ